jgi:hypothetical protein
VLFFRRPQRRQKAVEGTEGCREDRGPQRRQRVVEETEGRIEDKEP